MNFIQQITKYSWAFNYLLYYIKNYKQKININIKTTIISENLDKLTEHLNNKLNF